MEEAERYNLMDNNFVPSDDDNGMSAGGGADSDHQEYY